MTTEVATAKPLRINGKCETPPGWICYGVDCGHSYNGGHERYWYKYRCPSCGKYPRDCEAAPN